MAVRLRARLSQNLDLKTLMGWPELDPEGHPIQLMTDGLCAKIRHPRYAQITLTLLGYALVTNYLAVYAVFPPLVTGHVWDFRVGGEGTARSFWGTTMSDIAVACLGLYPGCENPGARSANSERIRLAPPHVVPTRRG